MQALALALALVGIDPYPHLPPVALCEERYKDASAGLREWQEILDALAAERCDWRDQLGGSAAHNWEHRRVYWVAWAREGRDQAQRVHELWYAAWWVRWHSYPPETPREYWLSEARRLVGDDAAWWSGSWWMVPERER